MKVLVQTSAPPKTRRRLADVLKLKDVGASPYGSTVQKTLLACPREYGLRYHAGLHPEFVNDALSAGWLWHYCLQRYYEEIQKAQRTSNAKQNTPEYLWGGAKAGLAVAYRVVETVESEPGYDEVAADVRRMLDQYFEVYSDRDRWRIVAVEETIIYRGVIDYSTRLDLLVEDLERGGLWIVEHKSARMVTSELLDNYQLDLQILGQVWLLKHCVDLARYPHFGGVKINIVTKHKTPQVVRIDVAPSNAHLQAFYDAQVQWKHVKGVMRTLGWPRSLGHCAGYARGYSRCQFFDVCHGHPQLGVVEWSSGDPPYGFLRNVP